jgi:hypothetical protein
MEIAVNVVKKIEQSLCHSFQTSHPPEERVNYQVTLERTGKKAHIQRPI